MKGNSVYGVTLSPSDCQTACGALRAAADQYDLDERAATENGLTQLAAAFRTMAVDARNLAERLDCPVFEVWVSRGDDLWR